MTVKISYESSYTLPSEEVRREHSTFLFFQEDTDEERIKLDLIEFHDGEVDIHNVKVIDAYPDTAELPEIFAPGYSRSESLSNSESGDGDGVLPEDENTNRTDQESI